MTMGASLCHLGQSLSFPPIYMIYLQKKPCHTLTPSLALPHLFHCPSQPIPKGYIHTYVGVWWAVYEAWPSSWEFGIVTIEECVRYVPNELPKWKILQLNIFLFMGAGGSDSNIRYGIPKYIRSNRLCSSKGSHL